jgi:amino acid transporter
MEDGVHSGITDKKKRGSLGTFAGVFIPSIMTILGIILFLRLGYVVGSAGLGRALIIIAIANSISLLTSFSLSAIATNLKVKGGGDYYLISRTLGVEFGGAIGIVLFLAQSVSIAFYCLGFGEALSSMLQETLVISPQIIAAFAVTILSFFAWLGADWATKFQYVVMTLLAVALISFFVGGLPKWEASLIYQNWAAPAGGPAFWVLFAIFFPAVTGFTQGVSMSGDLKDPGKSLPLGTFLSVGLSIIIYFGAAVIFAGTLSNESMTGGYKSMWHVARFSVLIDAGVIAATLSSAMASFLGAPRILQSLSADRIFPFLSYFAKGYGPVNNPRRAVLLSLGIAFVTVALGNLNVIAPVVSMFFLVSYGLLNYATFYEARSSSPSFRPSFRWFDYRISLLGFVACLGVMLAIDITAGAIAISVLFAIYQYLKRTAGSARWADSHRSHYLHQVRENLLSAYEEIEHPRDWRPQILAISDDPDRRKELLRVASWIQGGSGLITGVRIIEGEGLKMLRLRKESEDEMRKEIAALNLRAFSLVLLAPSFEVGLHTLIQAYGVGPIRANTIFLHFQDEFSKDIPSFRKIVNIQNLQTIFRLKCNIVMLNAIEKGWESIESLPPEKRRIDVWWWNDATSHLMLLLAYLMTRDAKWTEAVIRVIAVCYDKKSEKNIEDLKHTLEEIRIVAEPEVLENATAESITQYSEDAAMVFLPFQLRDRQILAPFGAKAEDLLSKLPLSAMFLAAEDIDLDAEPEEGRPQEIAAALDALEDALERRHETEKNAEKAAKAAVKAEKKLNAMIEAAGPGVSKEIMEQIEKVAKAADMAKERFRKAARKAASAQAKAQQVTHESEALGVSPIEKDDQTSEPPESE